MTLSTDPEQTHLSTLAEFALFLGGDNVPYKREKDRVLIPIAKNGLESTMAILWPEGQNIVQMILGYPFHVPEESRAGVYEAIGRLNHVLTMPGFGLDHDSGFAYYRLVQPRRRDGTLTAGDLQRLFATVTGTAAQFYRPLEAVAQGTVAGRDILEAARPGT